MRQQCTSTGKVLRPSEYIITQRATFLPTPGRLVKRRSHSASLIRRRGASVGLPNCAVVFCIMALMAHAFFFAKPPRAIAAEISGILAAANIPFDGNRLRKARKVSR